MKTLMRVWIGQGNWDTNQLATLTSKENGEVTIRIPKLSIPDNWDGRLLFQATTKEVEAWFQTATTDK